MIGPKKIGAALLVAIAFQGAVSGVDGVAPPSRVVEVATADQRHPIQTTAWCCRGNALPKSYVENLQRLFERDLSTNGVTVATKAPAPLVVRGDVDGSTLTLSYVDARGTMTTLTPLTLTGREDHDVDVVHSGADAVCRGLTAVTGIAATKLLYTLRQRDSGGNWISTLYECDSDGGRPRALTAAEGYCVTPSYIPPAAGHRPSSCLFVSYATGQAKIYAMALRGGAPQRLLYRHANQLMPTVSAQRDKIAFISDIGANADLMVQGFDPARGLQGRAIQLFSCRSGDAQASPTFSPDGKRLAFVSNKDGAPRIYIVDSETPLQKEAQLVSRRCRDNSAPAWAPDGSKIAYCAVIDGVRQIWIYDCHSGSERQLTFGSGNKENPSWAPNSRVLVYNSADGDTGELYTIALAYPVPRQITHGPGQKRFPSWERS